MSRGICKAPDCGKPHKARGYCHRHYAQFLRTGSALAVRRQKPGSSWMSNGYKVRSVDGVPVPEHVEIATKAYGKPLPLGAIVHHADENPLNNDPSNLVICPSTGYHNMLHRRTRAYNACGHATWRKCAYCKQWDDPNNLRCYLVTQAHKRCQQEYHRQRSLT